MEVVKGDLDDVPSLKAALNGAYGLYLVTNFWAHMKKETDTQQVHILLCRIHEAGYSHDLTSSPALPYLPLVSPTNSRK